MQSSINETFNCPFCSEEIITELNRNSNMSISGNAISFAVSYGNVIGHICSALSE